MSVRGLPEAAAVGFLGISLAAVSHLDKPHSFAAGVIAGCALLASWLMFMPAVLAAIVIVIFLHLDTSSKLLTIPSPFAFAAGVPSFLVGTIYLAVGPIRTALSAAGGSAIGFGSRPLFVINYGLIERSGRYAMYTWFDFWWHQRGFDAERHMISTVEGVEEFLGTLFGPIAILWIICAVALTAFIITGAFELRRERKEMQLLLFLWMSAFIVLYNLKNSGWTGAFMTRQIAPVYPAVCLLFGLGFKRVSDRSPNMSSITELHLTTIMVCGLLVVLLVAAAGQGMQTATDAAETQSEISYLDQKLPESAELGTLDTYTYYRTVLYSMGNRRPVVIVESSKLEESGRYQTSLAEIQTVQSYTENSPTDYIFILSKCRREYEKIRQMSENSDIVYEHHVESSGCDTYATLLR